MLRKFIPLFMLSLVILLQTSPVPLRAMELGPHGLVRVPFPTGTIPVDPPSKGDFNQSGSSESLELANGRLTIFSGSESVWKSPISWTVVQAEITDLNQDGTPEAALLVWRPFQAWPVDQWLPHGGRISDFHDDKGNSCHIILIGWRGSQFGELWAGSALAEPVKSFAAADLNGDHVQELVTLEGTYTSPASLPEIPAGSVSAHAIKVWEWNGFGFTVVSSMEGTYSKLAVAQAGSDHILILVP